MLEYIQKLEKEWGDEDRFLFILRTGTYNKDAFNKFLQTLKEIDLSNEQKINKRLVELMWYIPIFMEWQKSRIPKENVKDLEEAITKVTNEMEEIIGIP